MRVRDVTYREYSPIVSDTGHISRGEGLPFYPACLTSQEHMVGHCVVQTAVPSWGSLSYIPVFSNCPRHKNQNVEYCRTAQVCRIRIKCFQFAQKWYRPRIPVSDHCWFLPHMHYSYPPVRSNTHADTMGKPLIQGPGPSGAQTLQWVWPKLSFLCGNESQMLTPNFRFYSSHF